ncbi:hypothetical protein A2763_04525 [Candidatus Kaiserbacteria bacterium RIFCSPHIGHO2_01_FULL_54_36]|uniref:Uncharacterized protein n=1 Tax=Candidatus Kaiserbacteria bacterium RIFCSPHIGHO2_01_FULL_54_36 TaxID=1798482 RepID=A0A1F6CLV3_9BACT|nr:MAG: hypothetical protein A2763_04525 [Candidatus Kaiserbacteria bacterium RIFCSPHIGHO2_01_FULL_54_36]OGG75035.1 MAG: hypothetical protein A3A41_01960 [Candidatus Kaiserbacteria bacterium RIFCSPLOWO2_01_FULL_54_22]
MNSCMFLNKSAISLFSITTPERCGMDEAYFKLGLPRSDFREFDLEALALKELGVAKHIRFVSENEKKREAVRAAGFEIL